MINLDIDTDQGMTEEQMASFVSTGMGISNLVERATVRASELSNQELMEGGRRLSRLVDRIRPKVVAVAGVTAYRTAFGDAKASLGRQDIDGPAEWWVLPNPSGLNAHVDIAGLAGWFSTVAETAGVS